MTRINLMFAVLALSAGVARANVRLSDVFSDHMVLQREKTIKIWGEASAGERIRLSLGDASAEAIADSRGKWLIQLPARRAQTGLVLSIRGNNELTLHDVAVGEVWLCSGQSNMCTEVGFAPATKQAIAEANDPNIRYLHDGWHACNPQNVGSLSGVAYFFAVDIHKELKVPVGVIVRAQSMSAIQVWTPREAYSIFPELKMAFLEAEKAYIARVRQWADDAKKSLQTSVPNSLFTPCDGEMQQTSAWYDGQILPLHRYPLRGFLWYQGEANVADGMFYTTRQKAMVYCWRKAWGDMSMPFYFVQIAPTGFDIKRGQHLPTFWMAQMAAVHAIPNSEISHSCDLGYALHPPRKDLVGQRLARIALAKTYGKPGLVYAGPRYRSHVIEGKTIRVAFDFVGEGLVSRDGKPLTFFEIAGEDGQYMPAKAVIEGETIVVSSEKVDAPKNVRFAWNEFGGHNLNNKSGIPAYPFCTSPWPDKYPIATK